MKIDLKTCSEEELWKFVASHLKRKGIDTVLVGGAVVSIYTKGSYTVLKTISSAAGFFLLPLDI